MSQTKAKLSFWGHGQPSYPLVSCGRIFETLTTRQAWKQTRLALVSEQILSSDVATCEPLTVALSCTALKSAQIEELKKFRTNRTLFEGATLTFHLENGIKLKLDLAQVCISGLSLGDLNADDLLMTLELSFQAIGGGQIGKTNLQSGELPGVTPFAKFEWLSGDSTKPPSLKLSPSYFASVPRLSTRRTSQAITTEGDLSRFTEAKAGVFSFWDIELLFVPDKKRTRDSDIHALLHLMGATYCPESIRIYNFDPVTVMGTREANTMVMASQYVVTDHFKSSEMPALEPHVKIPKGFFDLDISDHPVGGISSAVDGKQFYSPVVQIDLAGFSQPISGIISSVNISVVNAADRKSQSYGFQPYLTIVRLCLVEVSKS